MNFWQRRWLSDRLHRTSRNTAPTPFYSPPLPVASAELEKPKRDPELARVLRLKLNPAKALKQLEEACYKDNPELVKVLLAVIPPDQLNNTPRQSSSALEKFVARGYIELPWIKPCNNEHLTCIELLLNAGARWNPAPESLRGIRRDILRHDVRYIVQLIRLLLYTPNIANIEQLIELCRSAALENKIGTVDQPLVREIKALRRSKHLPKTPDVATTIEANALISPNPPPNTGSSQPTTSES